MKRDKRDMGFQFDLTLQKKNHFLPKMKIVEIKKGQNLSGCDSRCVIEMELINKTVF